MHPDRAILIAMFIGLLIGAAVMIWDAHDWRDNALACFITWQAAAIWYRNIRK
jgi:hypothetical protein